MLLWCRCCALPNRSAAPPPAFSKDLGLPIFLAARPATEEALGETQVKLFFDRCCALPCTWQLVQPASQAPAERLPACSGKWGLEMGLCFVGAVPLCFLHLDISWIVKLFSTCEDLCEGGPAGAVCHRGRACFTIGHTQLTHKCAWQTAPQEHSASPVPVTDCAWP